MFCAVLNREPSGFPISRRIASVKSFVGIRPPVVATARTVGGLAIIREERHFALNPLPCLSAVLFRAPPGVPIWSFRGVPNVATVARILRSRVYLRTVRQIVLNPPLSLNPGPRHIPGRPARNNKLASKFEVTSHPKHTFHQSAT